MYIKKPVLIVGIILLVLAVAALAIGAVNPFGFTAYGELFKFSYVTRLIDSLYYEDVDREAYMNTALEGVAAATQDPYTGYLWGDDAQGYMEDLEGSYEGVGLYIENNLEDDTITVVSAIAGTPAEAAGIATGDKILKIDGQSYTGQQINEAAAAMRGLEGSQVVLTVLRKATGQTEDLTLTRRAISVQNVTSRMLTQEIGEIAVTQFTPGVADQFQDAFRALKDQGMQRLVIDLRNNPGGLVEEAVAVADLFVQKDQVVVYTLDKNGHREDYTAKHDAENLPVAVLTNGGSASASEILTGALKDYGVGWQIGETTYGKGVVQGVYQLGQDCVLSVTTARYYTPSGVCIHGAGIRPDQEVPMEMEQYARLSGLEPEQDPQIQAAVSYLSK